MVMGYVVAVLILVSTGLAADRSTQESVAQREAEGRRLLAAGQFVEAHRIFTRLAQDSDRCQLWYLAGISSNKLGRYEEAEVALGRAAQLCETGDPAPEFKVTVLVELADANLSRGHLEEAKKVLRRASEFASKRLPPRHPRVAAIQHSLGVLLWIEGQLSRAEKAFRLSMAILEDNLGADHVDVAVAASGLAGLLTVSGRRAEAIPLLERSRSTFIGAYGSSHPDSIAATYALGAALTKSAPANAELLLREAVENWRRTQQERHPNMIKFLSALANSLSEQGEYDEARINGERALKMSREIFGPEDAHTVAQMYAHAALLRAMRKKKEGSALEREADKIRAMKGYPVPNEHQIDVLALR
jgi:tetratricopeptide (TPR) repeat protein